MNKKSFFLGILTGIVLTIVVLFAIAKFSSGVSIQYLEQPVSYENKTESTFEVFQVFGSSALATESSDYDKERFNGNTVMILGEDFYTDQVVTIKNLQRVGTYRYTNNLGRPMTVPVIEGSISE